MVLENDIPRADFYLNPWRRAAYEGFIILF